MVEKETNNLIGHCGIMLDKNGDNEIGYAIDKNYWRKGFGFETSKAVLDHVFRKFNINKVVAYTKQANIASQNLMKSLGMKLWKEYTKNEIKCVAYKINLNDDTVNLS